MAAVPQYSCLFKLSLRMNGQERERSCNYIISNLFFERSYELHETAELPCKQKHWTLQFGGLQSTRFPEEKTHNKLKDYKFLDAVKIKLKTSNMQTAPKKLRKKERNTQEWIQVWLVFIAQVAENNFISFPFGIFTKYSSFYVLDWHWGILVIFVMYVLRMQLSFLS